METKADTLEPTLTHATTTGFEDDLKGDLSNRKHLAVQSVALANAVAKDAPDYRSSTQITMYAMMAFCVLNSIMNGYDGSVMSAINAMGPFQARFKIGMAGTLNGAVFVIYSVGGIVGALVVGLIMDKWGRRFSMFAGAILIVVGSILQASSHQLAQFMIGRFIVGLGNPWCATAAPVFLVEMAYPTWRGLAGGLYNVAGWCIGATIAAWTCYGTNYITNDWSWRIPYIVQIVPAAITLSLVWFLPESPRWLFSQGKIEKAMAILVKYHGNHNPNSSLVQLEVQEIREALEAEQRDAKNRDWDYRILVNNRPNRYRMWIVMLISVFSQFIGGSVISYYLPVILNGVGITKSNDQLLFNGINTIISFISGIFGSFFVDKLGRRPLLLWGTFLTGLVYIPLNVLAALAENAQVSGQPVSKSQGYAFIALIFGYAIFWCFCWTPLQALYPSEILNNEIRAKGMAAQGFIGGLAGMINLYGTSVALHDIGWKTYTIFLVLHFVQLILMYFVIIESKNRTLEEIDEIFSDPKPVKRSLQKTRVVVDRGHGAQIEDDA